MMYISKAPQLFAPKHGLVHSGNLVSTTDDHWENGVTFSPRGCYEVLGDCVDCPPRDKEDLQTCVEPVEFAPYVLGLGLITTPVNYKLDISSAIIEDMKVGTSSRLEALIWAGCTGGTSPILSEGTNVGTGTPVVALGLLLAEMISADDHIGAQSTIHISPAVAVQILGQFHEVNGDLYTVVGNHKVIIGNYPTNLIAGHLGDIDVFLGETFLTESPDEIRRANEAVFRVERTALAAWNSCSTYLVSVT